MMPQYRCTRIGGSPFIPSDLSSAFLHPACIASTAYRRNSSRLAMTCRLKYGGPRLLEPDLFAGVAPSHRIHSLHKEQRMDKCPCKCRRMRGSDSLFGEGIYFR